MAKNLVLWLIIAAVLLMVFQNFSPTTTGQQVNYSQFVEMVQQGRQAGPPLRHLVKDRDRTDQAAEPTRFCLAQAQQRDDIAAVAMIGLARRGLVDAAVHIIGVAAKIEDMLNTVVRQIAFFEFERKVHDLRREGEIPAEKLGEIWLKIQRESLGPAIRFEPEYAHYWAYIPHFLHAPFYVYAYAFGDCLVNSLYAVYQDAESGFQAKYFEMLRAGGTKHHTELLAPFGLDASDPAFWQGGLDVIAETPSAISPKITIPDPTNATECNSAGAVCQKNEILGAIKFPIIHVTSVGPSQVRVSSSSTPPNLPRQ